MPSYNVKDRATGAITVMTMTIAEMESLLASGKHDVIPGSVAQVREDARKHVSNGFKDLLKDVKRRNPGSTIEY